MSLQLSTDCLIKIFEILEDDKIENSLMNIDDKLITTFNDKKDFKLIKILKEILFITSLNSSNKKSAFYIGLSINKNNNENNKENYLYIREFFYILFFII